MNTNVSKDFLRKSKKSLILVSIFAILAASFAFLAFNTDKNSSTTFAHPDIPPLKAFTWGIDEGNVEMPEDVEFTGVSSLSQEFDAAAAGRYDAGRITLLDMGKVSDHNSDFIWTGYGAKVPPEWVGLHVREDSDIYELQDLEQSSIALPRNTMNGVLILMMLEDAGVDIDNLQIVNQPPDATKPLLESGDVDAAFITGHNHDNTRVLEDPAEYWRNEKDIRVASAMYYATGEENLDKSIQTVEAINNSLIYSDENTEEMIEIHKAETGQDMTEVFNSASNFRIIELNEEDLNNHQEIIDTSYEMEIIEEKFELENKVPQ